MLTNTERWYKGIRRKLEELKHSDYWDSIQLTETEKRIVKKYQYVKVFLMYLLILVKNKFIEQLCL